MKEIRFKWMDSSPANIKTIFDACIKALANPHSTGGLQLFVKGEKPGHQTARFLAGRNSPKGEIVSDVEGGQLVSFKCMELLAWMTALKFCTAEVPA